MSYRTYINGHEWLGNNEMYPEIHAELERQGCPFDEDDCVFDDNGFEVKDLNGLVIACEKALINICSKNSKIADFNDYVLNYRCNSMTLGLSELSDYARIFIGVNLLKYIGEEYKDWEWHPKTGFKLIGDGKCILKHIRKRFGMNAKRRGRPAKSVYNMTTKQYCNFLRKNRITKEWIIELIKLDTYLSYEDGDNKLTLAELVDKYGKDLKHMVGECCFEL